MQPTQQKFSIVYIILAVVGLLLLQALFFGPHTENLSYRDFKKLLQVNKIEDLAIGERTITGQLKTEGLEGLLPKEKTEELQRYGKGEHRFITVKVDDPALLSELEGSGIQFRGRVDSNWLGTLLSWILPAVVFVGIWALVMRRLCTASGMMAIGKSKAKVYVEKETGVTFDDVAGIDEARAELMELVDFLKTPERYRRLGGKIPQGGPARRGAWHRQDAAGQGRGRGSQGPLLQPERFRLRRDVRRCRGGARPGSLRPGTRESAEHHLHR
jgi:cell division protease FtsH